MQQRQPLGRPTTARQTQRPLTGEPVPTSRARAASTARPAGMPRQTGNTPKKTGNKRIASNLVALGSVAILSVYGIGYARTESVANAIAAQEGQVGGAPPEASGSSPKPLATILPSAWSQGV